MSKASKLDAFLKARIAEAIKDVAASESAESPTNAAYLNRLCDRITARAAYRIVYDDYRLRELYDIVSWKKPPRTPGA